MTDIAIRVEGLGKKYRLGINRARYKSLRESVNGLVSAPIRRVRTLGGRNPGEGERGHRPEFWALKDVNFDVKCGEVLGIIGRNGAGKSTLLKLLSRITEPTTGHVGINGRLASLLEVGTGFHPELTGRENVYLNGAILGMSRGEIDLKFDEIVAFAEIEKFVDTQVKHFSSGMYLRLAFAVAAHLEPEILMVDEVLAVGDLNFQRKCLNRMEAVGQQGRTVLFVSHNMPAITRLCERVLLLDGGRVLADGPAHQVVGKYLSSGLGTTAHRIWSRQDPAPGDEVVMLLSARVCGQDGLTTAVADIKYPVGVEIEYEVLKSEHILVPNFPFYNEEGVLAFFAFDNDPTWKRKPRPKGHYVSTAWIPGNFLSEGSMIVGVAISTMNPLKVHFYEQDAVAFQVVDSLDGGSVRGDFAGPIPGVVRPLLEWTTRIGPSASPRTVDSAN